MNAPASFKAHAVGRALPRVDGHAKVTGAARYTAEHEPDGLVHGVGIGSAVACGRVASIDSSEALALPGVLRVVTPETMLRFKPLPEKVQGIQYSGEGGLIEMLLPMQDDRIHYAGQILAIVIAETFEQATYAATKLRISYIEEPAQVDVDTAPWRSRPESYCGMEPLQLSNGNVASAYAAAEVQLERRYETPPHFHAALETMATIAKWEQRGDEELLQLWDTTRVIITAVTVFAHCLDIPERNIELNVPYLGGSFGSKAWMFGTTLVTAACARQIGRPLKIAWTRAQMYEVNGYRPETRHTLRIGADREGHIAALSHEAMSPTSMVSGFPEPSTGMTMMMYAVPNLSIGQEIRHLNLPTPMPMRGVGILAGGWALETAIDELAHELSIDPVDLRAMHDAKTGPLSGLPFSSKHLDACFERGKALIRWDERAKPPGEIPRGGDLVGLGVASSTLPAVLDKAKARATLHADGSLVVVSATHEIGNGAYTVFRQIAADAVALPVERVRFDLGRSDFPDAPITAGSRTTASVGAAVLDAGAKLIDALRGLAVNASGSPFQGRSGEELIASDGKLVLRKDPTSAFDYRDILRLAGRADVSADGAFEPEMEKKFETHSFGALFAKVRVNRDTGVLRVERIVGVFDVGRVINPLTANSQLRGAIIAGLGGALFEEGYFHPTNGRSAIRNLADYHIPSCADVPEISAETLDIPDMTMGALGARGLGELATNNVPAAIGNALFNATGRRLRELPLTPDRILAALA